jgi:hypothetical protein
MPNNNPTIPTKECPECHAMIDHLDWEGSYTEWGRCWGTRWSNNDYDDWDDQESNDSETQNKTYKCPECEMELEEDFFETDTVTASVTEATASVPAESEGDNWQGDSNKYHSRQDKIDKGFANFMKTHGLLSYHEREADENELKTLYPNEFRDFCQLNS